MPWQYQLPKIWTPIYAPSCPSTVYTNCSSHASSPSTTSLSRIGYSSKSWTVASRCIRYWWKCWKCTCTLWSTPSTSARLPNSRKWVRWIPLTRRTYWLCLLQQQLLLLPLLLVLVVGLNWHRPPWSIATRQPHKFCWWCSVWCTRMLSLKTWEPSVRDNIFIICYK